MNKIIAIIIASCQFPIAELGKNQHVEGESSNPGVFFFFFFFLKKGGKGEGV